jgi:hypothetical protein
MGFEQKKIFFPGKVFFQKIKKRKKILKTFVGFEEKFLQKKENKKLDNNFKKFEKKNIFIKSF